MHDIILECSRQYTRLSSPRVLYKGTEVIPKSKKARSAKINSCLLGEYMPIKLRSFYL